MMSATIVISVYCLSTLFFQVVYRKKKCWTAQDCAHLLQLIWRIYATPNQSRMPNVDASNSSCIDDQCSAQCGQKNYEVDFDSNFYTSILFIISQYFSYFNPRKIPRENCLAVKFIYSEKAKMFCEISTIDLYYVVAVKSTVDILQTCVAFSEYMNFINSIKIIDLYFWSQWLFLTRIWLLQSSIYVIFS